MSAEQIFLQKYRFIFFTFVMLLVAGCASQSVDKKNKPAAPTTAAMVTQIRAAGSDDLAEVFQPVRDPLVIELIDQASAHEQAGKLNDADAALAKALEVAPTDPDLLQRRAEVAVLRKKWPDAERFAMDSYNNGPMIGRLCERNWTTLLLLQQQQKKKDESFNETTSAKTMIERCKVVPPVRM